MNAFFNKIINLHEFLLPQICMTAEFIAFIKDMHVKWLSNNYRMFFYLSFDKNTINILVVCLNIIRGRNLGLRLIPVSHEFILRH